MPACCDTAARWRSIGSWTPAPPSMRFPLQRASQSPNRAAATPRRPSSMATTKTIAHLRRKHIALEVASRLVGHRTAAFTTTAGGVMTIGNEGPSMLVQCRNRAREARHPDLREVLAALATAIVRETGDRDLPA